MNLSEIGYDQVQSFVNELAKDVSLKTLHNVIVCRRVMLVGKKGASAVRRSFLRHDPTPGVELSTDARAGMEIDRRSGGTWVPGRDIVFLDAFTGLRRNEILAFQYTDIDWTNKELVIDKAVSKTKVSGGVRKWEWQIGHPLAPSTQLNVPNILSPGGHQGWGRKH